MTESDFAFSFVDGAVVAAYFVLLVVVGVAFKSLSKNDTDFFVGGHKVPWWMAGSSVFMAQFSAWTFTGAAGLAYQHGLAAPVYIWCNVPAFLIAYFFVAARWRQTRCVTVMEMIRDRFGPGAERFYTLMIAPISVVLTAGWLYGVSIFMATVMGLDQRLIIVAAGVVSLIYSALAGNWGAQAVDFVQMVVLLPATALLAIVTLFHADVGGITGFVAQMPPAHWNPVNPAQTFWFFVAVYVTALFSSNEAQNASRYLSVRDGREAKKVSLLVAGLFVVSPVVFFIPPMAATFLVPDIGAQVSGLAVPAEGAYALMTAKLLPVGLVGLVAAAILSASMSSMERTAGIISVNLYRGWLRPAATPREMLVAGRITNVLCGVAVVCVALYYQSLKTLGIFDIFLRILPTMLIPISVPGFLMLIVRRAPRWAAVTSTLASMAVGLVSLSGVIPELAWLARWYQRAAQAGGLPPMWAQLPWSFNVMALTLIGVATAFFLISCLFWRFESAQAKARIAAFYKRLETPLAPSELPTAASEGNRSLQLVGTISIGVGAALMLLMAIPSYSALDRLLVLVMSLSVAGFGYLLRRAGTRGQGRWGSPDDTLLQPLPQSPSA